MPENTRAHVLKITLHGICISEETINVFYYASATRVDPLVDVFTAFDGVVLTELPPVSTVNSLYTQVDIEEVKGGSTFDTFAITRPGTVSGDSMPPFVSWDFTLLRSGAGERNGYKRIMGVPETQQAGGFASAGALANLNNVAIGLAAILATTNDEYVPVIRRKTIHHVPQTPPKFFDISTVNYSRIGTQNSRKFGHGR